MHHWKVQFKNVRHYVLADDAYIPPEKDQLQASRDIVTNVAEIISVYLSFISRFADADPTGDSRFYHRPLANEKNGIPSFSQQVVGRYKLQKVMSNICKKGGLTGHFTSHTPKASLGTQLYHLNVDEQLIQERTGHRSVQAFRRYK